MNNNPARKAYSWFGFTYLVMYLFYMALVVLALLVTKLVNHGEALSEMWRMIISMSIRFVLIYPLMYLLVRHLPKFNIDQRKMGTVKFLGAICVTYIISYVSNIIGMIINTIWGLLSGNGIIDPIAGNINAMPPIVRILAVAVLAPIWEELLFRKFLIDRTIGYGEVPAMIMSGLMFGLYHGNLQQFSYASTIGIFFAFIYIKTGKIRYTIGLHAVVNGFSTFLTLFLSAIKMDPFVIMEYINNYDFEGYQQYIISNPTGIVVLMLLSIFISNVLRCGIMLLVVLISKLKKYPVKHYYGEMAKGKRFGTTVLNPGMLVFMVYWIGSIIATQFGFGLFETIRTALGLTL